MRFLYLQGTCFFWSKPAIHFYIVILTQVKIRDKSQFQSSIHAGILFVHLKYLIRDLNSTYLKNIYRVAFWRILPMRKVLLKISAALTESFLILYQDYIYHLNKILPGNCTKAYRLIIRCQQLYFDLCQLLLL